MFAKVLFTHRAEKDFSKLAAQDQKRVVSKLKLLTLPIQNCNLPIKKLVGIDNFYRFRIGDIRVIFEIDHRKREIWIRLIGYRSHIYKHL